jgi:hypothetical protein
MVLVGGGGVVVPTQGEHTLDFLFQSRSGTILQTITYTLVVSPRPSGELLPHPASSLARSAAHFRRTFTRKANSTTKARPRNSRPGFLFRWSGRQDLNLRPPEPHSLLQTRGFPRCVASSGDSSTCWRTLRLVSHAEWGVDVARYVAQSRAPTSRSPPPAHTMPQKRCRATPAAAKDRSRRR